MVETVFLSIRCALHICVLAYRMIPGIVRDMSQPLEQPGRREGQILAQDLVLHRVQHHLRRDQAMSWW